MSQTGYEDAAVLLFEPRHNVRQMMKSALLDMGFRRVADAAEFALMTERLRTEPFDLLIAELVAADGDVPNLVRQIRRAEYGRNPFLGVILTIWNPSVERVVQGANAGMDDLLGKPVSAQALRERIDALVKSRKPFVISADYVGPDRRRDPGRGSREGLMEAPNTLKEKVEGRADPERLQREIEAAAGVVRRVRRRRQGLQLAALAEIMSESAWPWPPVAADDLAKLAALCEDLARPPAAAGPAELPALARALAGLAADLRSRGAFEDARERQRLCQSAAAIHRLVAPDADEATLAAETSAVVAIIRQRRTQPSPGSD